MFSPLVSSSMYSHSTPVFITYPCSASRAVCRLRITRGHCSTSLPSIHRSAASQPISRFQGRMIKLFGSGIASMSGSAGVMSSQVANPAKPAPSSCMAPIAPAGTSLARSTPKRSTKLIKKYLIDFSFATCARSIAIISTSIQRYWITFYC